MGAGLHFVKNIPASWLTGGFIDAIISWQRAPDPLSGCLGMGPNPPLKEFSQKYILTRYDNCKLMSLLIESKKGKLKISEWRIRSRPTLNYQVLNCTPVTQFYVLQVCDKPLKSKKIKNIGTPIIKQYTFSEQNILLQQENQFSLYCLHTP